MTKTKKQYFPDISYNYAPAAAFFDEDDVPEDDHFEEEVCFKLFAQLSIMSTLTYLETSFSFSTILAVHFVDELRVQMRCVVSFLLIFFHD